MQNMTLFLKKFWRAFSKFGNLICTVIGVLAGVWFAYNFLISNITWVKTESRPAISIEHPEEFQKRFEELVESAHESLGLDYAAGISVEGRPVWVSTKGQWDEDLKIDINTPIPIGSVSKQFLASAFMKLADLGKLSLDQNMCSIMQELCGSEIGDVQIHFLLNHTSGLPRDGLRGSLGAFLSELSRQYKGDLISPAVLVEEAGTIELSDKPGSKYLYSNLGYELLSIALMRITGLSFSESMDNLVFKPAGLHNTFVPEPGRPRS